MKKLTPLKTVQLIVLIALCFQIAQFFMEEKYKTTISIITCCLLFGTFIYAMFNSGKIEQEKIEREERKQAAGK